MNRRKFHRKFIVINVLDIIITPTDLLTVVGESKNKILQYFTSDFNKYYTYTKN